MYIEEFRESVPKALCDRIVDCFERAPSKRLSYVSVNGKTAPSADRKGTMLVIDRSVPEWEEIFQALVPSIRSTVDEYLVRHPGLAALVDAGGIDCTIPLIEKTEPGEGFGWHYDVSPTDADRVLAGLLYLTTISEGGYTEFADPPMRVNSEAGKIVLFPPYWTHLHRGVAPERTPKPEPIAKYVVSFFWKEATR